MVRGGPPPIVFERQVLPPQTISALILINISLIEPVKENPWHVFSINLCVLY